MQLQFVQQSVGYHFSLRSLLEIVYMDTNTIIVLNCYCFLINSVNREIFTHRHVYKM